MNLSSTCQWLSSPFLLLLVLLSSTAATDNDNIRADCVTIDSPSANVTENTHRIQQALDGAPSVPGGGCVRVTGGDFAVAGVVVRVRRCGVEDLLVVLDCLVVNPSEPLLNCRHFCVFVVVFCANSPHVHVCNHHHTCSIFHDTTTTNTKSRTRRFGSKATPGWSPSSTRPQWLSCTWTTPSTSRWRAVVRSTAAQRMRGFTTVPPTPVCNRSSTKGRPDPTSC